MKKDYLTPTAIRVEIKLDHILLAGSTVSTSPQVEVLEEESGEFGLFID